MKFRSVVEEMEPQRSKLVLVYGLNLVMRHQEMMCAMIFLPLNVDREKRSRWMAAKLQLHQNRLLQHRNEPLDNGIFLLVLKSFFLKRRERLEGEQMCVECVSSSCEAGDRKERIRKKRETRRRDYEKGKTCTRLTSESNCESVSFFVQRSCTRGFWDLSAKTIAACAIEQSRTFLLTSRFSLSAREGEKRKFEPLTNKNDIPSVRRSKPQNSTRW